MAERGLDHPPSVLDYYPIPDLVKFEAQESFSLAMEAYAQYARDMNYPYLVAWKPWLHVASRLRVLYGATTEEGLINRDHAADYLKDLAE